MHVMTVDLRIRHSSRGSTFSQAEEACAVLLPTASACKMSTGTPWMGSIVCEFMDNETPVDDTRSDLRASSLLSDVRDSFAS
jgi:hypothetical protein